MSQRSLQNRPLQNLNCGFRLVVVGVIFGPETDDGNFKIRHMNPSSALCDIFWAGASKNNTKCNRKKTNGNADRSDPMSMGTTLSGKYLHYSINNKR